MDHLIWRLFFLNPEAKDELAYTGIHLSALPLKNFPIKLLLVLVPLLYFVRHASILIHTYLEELTIPQVRKLLIHQLRSRKRGHQSNDPLLDLRIHSFPPLETHTYLSL